jgi:hypothetical protein
MISQKQYVPILKGKMGEFSALNILAPEVKNAIVPIIDIVTPPNTKKMSLLSPKKKLETHLETTVKYFSKYWGKSSKIYVDCYMLQSYSILGKHPIELLFNSFLSENLNTIPVISNITDFNYNNAVKNIINKEKKGVALRIFRKKALDVASEIHDLHSFLDIDPSQIDLVIDLRSLEEFSLSKARLVTLNIVSEIPNLSKWRSFILAGGNFPVDLTDITADQVFPLPRTEWQLWKSLILKNDLDRIPTYSDYAISHPRIVEIDSEHVNASASIRYTHEEDFFIYRGKGTRQHGYEQFYDISESLINSSEFYGASHCYGDQFISTCATEKKRKGNLTDWRRVGTNHHITVVVNQLLQFWRDFKVVRTS